MIGLAALVTIMAAATHSDSLMAPGVSHELARYRAAHIRDVRYHLALELTRRDTVVGTARISFTRVNGGDVYLDFRGYEFSNVVINGAPVEAVEYNRAHMRFQEALFQDGENTIDIVFKSPIAPAGASVIRFTDDTDKREYLYTLLVPSDANLLFPCFDQPDIKAVFELGLALPLDWTALSNGKISSVVRAEMGDRATTVWFAATKPISTYLLAFAAGPFRQLHDPQQDIALWVRDSRAREVERDTLIALNRRARAWMSQYFGVPYPFDKLDF
ncbi:MAG TPA: hypothetical protein VIF32_11385, partial [Gemmatimonadaceae bacterium]